jgi:hypothetical protein
LVLHWYTNDFTSIEETGLWAEGLPNRHMQEPGGVPDNLLKAPSVSLPHALGPLNMAFHLVWSGRQRARIRPHREYTILSVEMIQWFLLLFSFLNMKTKNKHPMGVRLSLLKISLFHRDEDYLCQKTKLDPFLGCLIIYE